MRPDRHSFVWLTPAWKRRLLDIHNMEDEHYCFLDEWAASGQPFVVASSLKDDPIHAIRLGVATPKKERFGLLVHKYAISKCIRAPALRDVSVIAPPFWTPVINRVLAGCSAHGLQASVYGSLAWSYLSGLEYLRPESDLDLLLRVIRPDGWQQAISEFASMTATPRLDGELLLPGGDAISFRELDAAPPSILVKGHGGARIADTQTVIERLANLP